MSKPKGHFNKILFMDAETSGLAFNSNDPSYDANTGETFQAVSWGLVLADAQTLKVIDELYVEIKWDGESTWSDGAERVHGMSKKYLEENGMDEEEAVCEIGSFILNHYGPEPMVHCAGHNVATFDIFFMRRLLNKYDIMFKTGNRFVDTNSIGYGVYDTYNSDDLFDLVGVKRNEHNALEDAKASLKVVRTTRKIFEQMMG